MQRTLLLAAAIFAFAIPSTSQADIVAGLENWANGGGGSETVSNTAIVSYTAINGSLAVDGSTDGTWGTHETVPPADATTDAVNDVHRLNNGTDDTFTFTFTDTSGLDTELGAFHFDGASFRPGSARNWTLSVLAGSSISVVSGLESGTLASVTGGVQDWTQVDIDLTGLADFTLDANGSAVFELAFTGGNGGGGHHGYLDNVAVSTVAVPEPGSLSLFAFGSIGLMLRRRK